MKIKNKIKIGDTIKIKDDHEVIFKGYKDNMESAEYGLLTLSDIKKNYHKKMFETLYSLYPQLDGFDVNINHETGVITVLGKQIE